MRTIWKILEAAKEQKYMVRLGMWPGGNISVGIYNNTQDKQYLYEGKSYEEIETQMIKDLGHLIKTFNIVPDPSLKPNQAKINFPSFPTPVGFPKL